MNKSKHNYFFNKFSVLIITINKLNYLYHLKGPPSNSTRNDGPPVIILDASETVHVTIDNKQTSTPKHQVQNKASVNNINSASKTSQAAVIEIQTNEQRPTTPALRTIELSSGRVREGFANGEIIVTLQPGIDK